MKQFDKKLLGPTEQVISVIGPFPLWWALAECGESALTAHERPVASRRGADATLANLLQVQYSAIMALSPAQWSKDEGNSHVVSADIRATCHSLPFSAEHSTGATVKVVLIHSFI